MSKLIESWSARHSPRRNAIRECDMIFLAGTKPSKGARARVRGPTPPLPPCSGGRGQLELARALVLVLTHYAVNSRLGVARMLGGRAAPEA